MSSASVEQRLESALRRTPVTTVADPQRIVRFVQFCAVGALGMLVDLSITLSLIGHVNYLLANAAGFVVAVTWNFAGNWRLTYDRPEGTVRWQYLSYVVLHSLTFGLRALTITLLVEAGGAPPSAATIVGVGIAAIANFSGTEGIFGGAGETWFDVVEAGNHVAHVVYGSRLRTLLVWTGAYQFAFDAYAEALRVCYRASEREVSVGDASATLKTEGATETVSVLHTLEKEREVLNSFVEDVRHDDRILDVGANVGLYSCLGGDVADDVVAVEPHESTANRCQENLRRNDVSARTHDVALGASVDTVSLAVTNDAVGTQRPEVKAGDGIATDQWPGDLLVSDQTPNVVKIDVEGAETEVIQGLCRTLADDACRVVYVEAHDGGEDLTAILSDHGFEVDQLAQNEQTYLRGER